MKTYTSSEVAYIPSLLQNLHLNQQRLPLHSVFDFDSMIYLHCPLLCASEIPMGKAIALLLFAFSEANTEQSRCPGFAEPGY